MPYAISSSGNISGVKLEIAEVLFVSVSSESFSLGYSASGILSFSICLCGSWLLFEFSLNWEQKPDQLNHDMIQTFCFSLQHHGLLVFAVCFDTVAHNLIAIVFHLWTGKHKHQVMNKFFRTRKSLSDT